MNNEEEQSPNQETPSEAKPEGAADDRHARRTGKRVVNRVRDATSRKGRSEEGEGGDSGASDRREWEDDASAEREPEIETIMESAPSEGRSDSSRDDRRRSGRGRRGGRSPGQQGQGQSRGAEPVDPDELATKAWKIYQADVAEEGIILIDNSAARSLALRSFELARMFLEEKTRQAKLRGASQDGGDSRREFRNEDRDDDED